MPESNLELAEVGQIWADPDKNYWQVSDIISQRDDRPSIIRMIRTHGNTDRSDGKTVNGDAVGWQRKE